MNIEMTLSEKNKNFSNFSAKELAKSFGIEVPSSPMVDISDEKREKAIEMATVEQYTKSGGGVSVDIFLMYDGNNKAVSAYSPQNPNVKNAPIAAILKALGI